MQRRLKVGIIFLVACLLLSGLAISLRRPNLPPYQNGEYIPADLQDAHACLITMLTEEDLQHIRSMESEDEMIEYHHGLGRYLRNKWGLWGKSRLWHDLHRAGFRHPDDMSSVILKTFWCRLHNRPFRLEERAEEYRSYW